MIRICVRNSDNRIIESHSIPEKTAGVLIANAVSSGYLASAVHEEVVTEAEFKARRAIQDFGDMTYAQKRVAEYPSVGDQLDDLFQNGGNFSPEMQARIQAIKDKYPKPIL